MLTASAGGEPGCPQRAPLTCAKSCSLRAAARRAVLAADPAAARERRERAAREARVERWDEHAGTAALAGRDLPPADVLAADHNLSALASSLRRAGVSGTMDQLRAKVYLALLTGQPITALTGRETCIGGSSAGTAPGGAGHDGPGPGTCIYIGRRGSGTTVRHPTG